MTFPGKLITIESVAAFKGAKKKDSEGFLDGFAALGILAMEDEDAPAPVFLRRCSRIVWTPTARPRYLRPLGGQRREDQE